MDKLEKKNRKIVVSKLFPLGPNHIPQFIAIGHQCGTCKYELDIDLVVARHCGSSRSQRHLTSHCLHHQQRTHDLWRSGQHRNPYLQGVCRRLRWESLSTSATHALSYQHTHALAGMVFARTVIVGSCASCGCWRAALPSSSTSMAKSFVCSFHQSTECP